MKIFEISIFLLVIHGSGCKQGPEASKHSQESSLKDTTLNYCFKYPGVIDSLNLQSLYDSARWQLYTWHCDKDYMSKKDTSRNVKKTFGLVPLIFDSCVIKSDTIEFIFDFVDGTDTVRATELREYVYIKNGIAYNVKSKKKLYLISLNNYTLIEKGETSRFEVPLQPEVKKYIDSNWNKIDPCFKILAAKTRSIN